MVNRRDMLRQIGAGFGALSLNTLLAAGAAKESGNAPAGLCLVILISLRRPSMSFFCS